MNISWAADSAFTESYVEYALEGSRRWRRGETIQEYCTVFDSIWSKNASGENFFEEARFNKCGAELHGLKPNRNYRYRVISGGGDTSAIHHFKTSGAKSWKACIISDFHCYPPLPNRLEAGMAMVDTIGSKDGYDWVLHVGDVCAWGGSRSFWQYLYSQKNFEKSMWAGVNGNHDNMSRKYQLTNQYFKNANHYPRNGYQGEEGVCYWFKYGDALFIMLNSESMRSPEGLETAKNWIEGVVRRNPAKYRIVATHYQWFFGETGKPSQYSRFQELFDHLGIDLAIAGNNHIYVRTAPLYDGQETDGSHGTVYLQSCSSDNERGVELGEQTENFDIIKFRWAEGGKTVGAMSLDVNPKRMVVIFRDRYGNELDSFTVKAK